MKRKKTAIIFGINGQDGAYLANFLLKKKYRVIGTTRKNSKKKLDRLIKLNILNKIKIIKGIASEKNFCRKIINNKVNEIYYLSGNSSVIKSFDHPVNSIESNTTGILNILQTAKEKATKTKIFNSGSGQFFGNNKKNTYKVNSKIMPQSPYGVAKAAGYWITKIYRENFGLYCCTGILFNHESPLRSNEFVTKKIVDTSKKIKKNKKKILKLGNINISRDWGWAPDFVEGFWLMLQQKKPIDLILGTGKSHTIREFVNEVFRIQKT